MPNTKVVVNLDGSPAYDVRIGQGLLEGVGEKVRAYLPDATRAVLVSDTNVAPLYGSVVRESLKQAGLAPVDIVVPAGEQSKSLDVAGELWQALAAKKIDRDACVVALGGGVVGDLAGFIAATFLRGISYVQLPTTLLAMVDSSVGGKTAINLDAGKNMVGAFKQPAYVCADTMVLDTLPEREWASGLGEVAKSAALDSDDFFFWLAEHAGSLATHDADTVAEAITRCVVFKANVVAADETERTGVRACLNYGHTLGHAIEKLAGFGTFSHGQAVAEGTRFAARLAVAELDASRDFMEAQDDLLDTLGLHELDFEADPESVLEAMRSDKKARAGQVRFVLLDDVGSWQVRPVDEQVILEHLRAWLASKS